MTHTRFALAFATLALTAAPAAAGCFADYKAKQDDPLRLHYGVVELAAETCPDPADVWDEVEARLAAAGWTLLDVVEVFEDDGLDRRRRSAGENFLRY